MISRTETLELINPDRPFFSHATKDFSYFANIVRTGSLICPQKLVGIKKFSSFTDEYVGRTKYVMFSPGFGYIVDNANMDVAFLFTDWLLTCPGVVLHIRPAVFAMCKMIVRTIKQKQREYWIEFFCRPRKSLDCFNHPQVKMAFRDYMLEVLSSEDDQMIYGDTWGPSTYSEGIIKILYESNLALRAEMSRMISSFNSDNTLEGRSAREHMRQHWRSLNIYRHPQDRWLSDDEKTHTQLLIPDHVPIWRGGMLGLCVSLERAPAFAATLRGIMDYIPSYYLRSLPVYCGSNIYSIDELLKIHT
jgi:hypothetical protein